MDFVREQMIPYIKSIDDEVVLIHLGDVFDSRSTVNTYIAQEVKELFEELFSSLQENEQAEMRKYPIWKFKNW